MLGKINHRIKKREKKLISIGGVSRGTGTTFCTMMAAYFIKKVKKEKALIKDLSSSKALERLCMEEKVSTWKGIDILGQEERIEKESQNIILDCGMLMKSRQSVFSEFCSSQKRIVTASLCAWKKRELEEFVECCQDMDGNEEWIYLVPFAEKSAVKNMEKKLHRRMYAVEAQREWWRMGAVNLALWEEIWEEL